MNRVFKVVVACIVIMITYATLVFQYEESVEYIALASAGVVVMIGTGSYLIYSINKMESSHEREK